MEGKIKDYIEAKRILILFSENGYEGKQGIIELRPGVPDMSIGERKYAQIRIWIDETHYVKGLAFYSNDIPDGYDAVCYKKGPDLYLEAKGDHPYHPKKAFEIVELDPEVQKWVTKREEPNIQGIAICGNVIIADCGDGNYVSLIIRDSHCQNCQLGAEECEYCEYSGGFEHYESRYYCLTMDTPGGKRLEHYEIDPFKALKLFFETVSGCSIQDMVLTDSEKQRRQEEMDFIKSSAIRFAKRQAPDGTNLIFA